jgi:LuxR family transcriptional regulator, maltose regulon positive regulatory protein
LGGSHRQLDAHEERTLTPPTRRRLLALINPAIPAIFIEGGVGTHKAALLRSWEQQPSDEIRLVVEFDPRQSTPAAMARLLAYQLALAGVPQDEDPGDETTWGALSHLLATAVDAVDTAVVLGVLRMDELPSEASCELIRLAGSLAGFNLVATAVDAQALVREAVAGDVGHQLIGDRDLAYSHIETAGLLAEHIPHATDDTVRAVLEATHGIPALVERVIALFPTECVAGTIDPAQAVAGWIPDRQGAKEFWNEVRQLAQASRFSVALLTRMFGRERAAYLFDRLPRMGFGAVAESPSGEWLFRWYPVLRQHLLLNWHADVSTEQFEADRAAIAEAAAASSDPELALTMLVANYSLPEAEKFCDAWLWELCDASARHLWTEMTGIDPQLLAQYPSLLATATLLQPGRGEPSTDAAVAAVQQEFLSGAITGSVKDQMFRLAKAAVVAFGTGELGMATRAVVRWAGLLEAHPEEVRDGVPPELVSDGLLVMRMLLQLDRIDLVAKVARTLLWPLRRQPNLVIGRGDRRLSSLIVAVRMTAILLGTSRADVSTMEVLPRQYHREYDLAMNAIVDAGEALDRGDLASAEAFTRVASFRLPRAAEWSVLVYLRTIALVALGDRDTLEELVDEVLGDPRWEAWQHHPEAPGMFALLTESLLQSSIQLGPRSSAEISAFVKALPPGAQHRWSPWGKRMLEACVLVGAGAARGPMVPTDEELEPDTPRIGWHLGLISAINNLRAGEEATAVSVMLRGGARLKYQTAPWPMVLATREEVVELIEGLPTKTPPLIRSSLSLARGYAGVEPRNRSRLRLAEREMEVLDGVRRGLTNTAIAAELFVSVNTVKFHRANLYRKLNATSREELLAEALRQGL